MQASMKQGGGGAACRVAWNFSWAARAVHQVFARSRAFKLSSQACEARVCGAFLKIASEASKNLMDRSRGLKNLMQPYTRGFPYNNSTPTVFSRVVRKILKIFKNFWTFSKIFIFAPAIQAQKIYVLSAGLKYKITLSEYSFGHKLFRFFTIFPKMAKIWHLWRRNQNSFRPKLY